MTECRSRDDAEQQFRQSISGQSIAEGFETQRQKLGAIADPAAVIEFENHVTAFYQSGNYDDSNFELVCRKFSELFIAARGPSGESDSPVLNAGAVPETVEGVTDESE